MSDTFLAHISHVAVTTDSCGSPWTGTGFSVASHQQHTRRSKSRRDRGRLSIPPGAGAGGPAGDRQKWKVDLSGRMG
ncbi:hypothetical protein UVI_02018240 [Ustilaginoidea virens]|uniref:Uncharacterized protein n=1 Tax=Ustilaginoidea virens TaxID=1159556 RepID=A0A1B5KS88_USTVR|nr:hypothetical protein UVI_02018240 [Ustilaginoidea virens]